jgi:hypothetical protein
VEGEEFLLFVVGDRAPDEFAVIVAEFFATSSNFFCVVLNLVLYRYRLTIYPMAIERYVTIRSLAVASLSESQLNEVCNRGGKADTDPERRFEEDELGAFHPDTR